MEVTHQDKQSDQPKRLRCWNITPNLAAHLILKTRYKKHQVTKHTESPTDISDFSKSVCSTA